MAALTFTRAILARDLSANVEALWKSLGNPGVGGERELREQQHRTHQRHLARAARADLCLVSPDIHSARQLPKMSDAPPDYTVAHSRPECLNRLTSLLADSCSCDRSAWMIAPRTASQVTAGTAPNDYQ